MQARKEMFQYRQEILALPKNVAIFFAASVLHMQRDDVLYHIFKDGYFVTVQAPSGWKQLGMDVLEVIQSLIETVEFGKANWAYLAHSPGQGYRLIQRCRALDKVFCPAWTPLIHGSEIEYTNRRLGGIEQGLWKGRPVDIIYCRTDDYVRKVNRAMVGAKAIQDLDLTFEIYGHIVNDNGDIVGLVTEAAKGRDIQLCDRSAVYKAVSMMQQRGIVYTCAGCGGLVIHNGKVRVVDLTTLFHYLPDQHELLEQDAQFYHWSALEELFQHLEQFGELALHHQAGILWGAIPVIFFPPITRTKSPSFIGLYYFRSLSSAFIESSEQLLEERSVNIPIYAQREIKKYVAFSLSSLGAMTNRWVTTFSGISPLDAGVERREVTLWRPKTSSSLVSMAGTSTSVVQAVCVNIPKAISDTRRRHHRRVKPMLYDRSLPEDEGRFEEING